MIESGQDFSIHRQLTSENLASQFHFLI